jgi:hypothetical protein
MEEYVWNLMSSGVTDILKGIVGKSFSKLQDYFTRNKQDEFNEVLSVIMESNDEIKKKLELLKNGDYISQNHSGTGDNIVGDKTINNTYHISSVEDKEAKLSIEAEELLKEATEDKDGVIWKMNFLSDGLSVTTNNNQRYALTNSGYKYIESIIN